MLTDIYSCRRLRRAKALCIPGSRALAHAVQVPPHAVKRNGAVGIRVYGFPLCCGGHRSLQAGPSDFVAEDVPGRMDSNAFLINLGQ